MTEFDPKGLENVKALIVMQAVEDWRYLCGGGRGTRVCNFKELEQFFTIECELLISSNAAERIWTLMRWEKRKAEIAMRWEKRRAGIGK